MSAEEALRTAVILPDEHLLIPVLNAIPEQIKRINVTMGYPLAGTPVASLMEYILALQKNIRYVERRPVFYFRDVLPILNHRYISTTSPEMVSNLVKDISENNGQMADSYANYQIVNISDFAMNHMDLLTGGIGISQYNGVTSPDYRVFNLKDNKMNPRYFLYIFETYYRNKIFYAFGQGAANLGRWRLPAKNFYSIYIPVAPIEEQQAIVSYLDQKCTQIDNLIAIKQKKIEKLQQYISAKIKLSQLREK